MFDNWDRIKLKDLLEVPIRNGLTKPTAVRGEGVRMVGMKEIFAYDRIGNIEMDRVPVNEKELTSCRLSSGDLLFARQSLVLEGAGKCSIVIDAPEDTVFESHLIRLRVNADRILPKFVYYYFKSPTGRNAIMSLVEQVAAAGIRGKELIELEIPVPPMKDQERIVKILEDFDIKIEIDEQIKDNLYGQALARYKHDFEEVVEGSTNRMLGEVTNQLSDRVGENGKYTVLSAINTGILKPSDEYFTKRVYSKDTKKYIVVNTGNFAYNPARVNIGSIGINDLGYIGCVSPVYVVFSVAYEYQSFFKFYFRSKRFGEECVTRASGSVRQTLNYKDFSQISIAYPKKEKADAFNRYWINVKEQMDHYDAEIGKLREIRDLLNSELIR